MRGGDITQFQKGLNARAAAKGWKLRVRTDGVFNRSDLRLWRKVRYAIGLPKGHPPTMTAQLNVRQPWTRSPAAKKRAQERRPKRPRKGQLSKYWHLSEFNCRDGTPVPACIIPELREHCRHTLDPLRERYGPGACNSGYRHRAYNASIGGATMSWHIYDLRCKEPATDVTFGRGSPSRWADTASATLNGGGGIGVYAGSNFTHVDPRAGSVRWWG